MKNTDTNSKAPFGGWFAVVCVSALAITVWWYYDAKRLSECSTEIAVAGQIGDSFGPLTSLFTSLALGAAILSTWYQVREFRSQLEEMKQSREEMEEQTITYKLQLLELKTQTSLLHEQLLQERLRNATLELPFFEINFDVSIQTFGIPQHHLMRVRNSGHRIYAFNYQSTGFRPHSQVQIVQDSQGTTMGIESDGFQRCLFPIEFDSSIGHACQAGCSISVSYILASGVKMEELLSFPKPSVDVIDEWVAMAVSNRSEQAAFLEKRLRGVRYTPSEPSNQKKPFSSSTNADISE